MKILLSAYACEPQKGSEPAVGWNWAVTLIRGGHDVWVLTRSNNREQIEKFFDVNPHPDNLHFIYYDLPRWGSWWKSGRQGIHLYYLLWQWGAYRVAKTVHAEQQFDLIHHVTFVSVRQPSFLGWLGVPFVFGPVAGGERIPWRLRAGCGFRGWIEELVRDVANLVVQVDPMMWQTFWKADKIFVTSAQTSAFIPRCFHRKLSIQLAIGQSKEEISLNRLRQMRENGCRILFVGSFLYLKGMHLGLPAFARFSQVFPDATLTMVGQGKEEANWRALAAELGIAPMVKWIGWTSREQVLSLYNEHDFFLFPSLRDSGGMVVLEAMAHGLPVVCLDLGGPGVMVNDVCGIKIAVHGLDSKAIIDKLAQAMVQLYEDREAWQCRHDGAIARVMEYDWQNLYSNIYKTLC
jgi:glycosyltransferase involved in cell wall biosynthesis